LNSNTDKCVIERIINKRRINGKLEYFIKWFGWGDDHCSWKEYSKDWDMVDQEKALTFERELTNGESLNIPGTTLNLNHKNSVEIETEDKGKMIEDVEEFTPISGMLSNKVLSSKDPHFKTIEKVVKDINDFPNLYANQSESITRIASRKNPLPLFPDIENATDCELLNWIEQVKRCDVLTEQITSNFDFWVNVVKSIIQDK
jgi:hypothetical protein